MATYALAESEFSERAATVETYGFRTDDASMSLVAFIERRFIPNHVSLKSTAGRTHYQAILKHIVRPETVQTLFAQYPLKTKARLTAVPGWPYLDDVRLCDLNTDHVRQLTGSAAARGYSTQTVKHIKNVLGTIISHAQREHLFVGDNPAAEVRLPRLVHTTPRDLTIDEAKAILRMLKYPEREIALMSMSTGMGISEICGLKWKHVNLTRSTLCVEGESVPPRGIVFTRHRTDVDGANVISNRLRVTVVPESLISVLERLKGQQKRTGPNSFVITTPQGDPTPPISARVQRLKPIGRRLQIPWLSWQVLKRAHGAFLLDLSRRITDDLVGNIQDL